MDASKIRRATPASGRRGAVAAATVLLLAALLARGAVGQRTATESRTAGAAWVDRGLHVVAGPVAASGRMLVLVSAPDHSVWLEAIRPASGTVAWKVRYGFSLITSGVAQPPVADGGIAFALVPVSPSSAIVRLEGIEIATGKAVWHGPAVAIVADAPTACPAELGSGGFCLTVATGASRTNLVALSARGGQLLASIPDVTRLMSDLPGLYEWAAKAPALVQVALPGGVRWKIPVSRLFGADHDPNFGWDFARYGKVGVGSVGHVIKGMTVTTTVVDVPLGGYVTAGYSEASGKLLWRRPGAFRCGNALGIHAAFLCVLSGSAVETVTGGFAPSKGAAVTIEGLDPASGAITWRHRVGDIAGLLEGEVAVADDDQIVVHVGARLRVLDLATGALSSPAAGQVFWCGHENPFVIAPVSGVPARYRQGQTLFAPCSASMRALSPAVVPSTPSVAGAAVGGMAVWAGVGGLAGARLGVKHALTPGIAA